MARVLAILLLGGACSFAAPRRYRQFDVDSYERLPYYADCPDGYVLRYDGECVETRVHKRFFIYKSPRNERREPEIAVLQNTNRNYNYVFVKSPDVKVKDSLVIAPPKEQTLIYLLAKNQKIQRQVVELENDNEKPELYHVNYSDENENVELPGGIDLQTALSHTLNQESYEAVQQGSYEQNFFNSREGFQSSYRLPSSREGRVNNFRVLDLSNYGNNDDLSNDQYNNENGDGFDSNNGQYNEENGDGLDFNNGQYNEENGDGFDGDLRGDLEQENALESESQVDAQGDSEFNGGNEAGEEGGNGFEQISDQEPGVEGAQGSSFGAGQGAGIGSELGDNTGGGAGQSAVGGVESQARQGADIETGAGSGFGNEGEQGLGEQHVGQGFQDQIGSEPESGLGGQAVSVSGTGFVADQQVDAASDHGAGSGFETEVGTKANEGFNAGGNLDPSPGLASTISVGLDGAPSAAFETTDQTQSIADQLSVAGKSIVTSVSGSAANRIKLDRFEKVPKANLNFGDRIQTDLSNQASVSDAEHVNNVESTTPDLPNEIIEESLPSDVPIESAVSDVDLVNNVEAAVSNIVDELVEEPIALDVPVQITVSDVDLVNNVEPAISNIARDVEEEASLIDSIPTATIQEKQDELDVIEVIEDISPAEPSDPIVLEIEAVDNSEDTLLREDSNGTEINFTSIDTLSTLENDTVNDSLTDMINQENGSVDGISLFILDENIPETTEESVISKGRSFDATAAVAQSFASVDDTDDRPSFTSVTEFPLEPFTMIIGTPVKVPKIDSVQTVEAETEESLVRGIDVQSENVGSSFVDTFFETLNEATGESNSTSDVEQIETNSPVIELVSAPTSNSTGENTRPTSFTIFNENTEGSLQNGADVSIPANEQRQSALRKRFSRFF